jgi:hypothetical protein
MNKEFVPYKQALELKELGFDEPCFGYFNTDEELVYGIDIKTIKYVLKYHKKDESVLAPTYQQAFRWFEDNQSMFIERIVTTNANEIMDIEYNIKSWRFPTITIEFDDSYDSFDKNKAELACLIKLISIVKEQNNEK